MPAIIVLVAVWALLGADPAGLFTAETERLITQGLQFVTIIIVVWHSRHVTKVIEPEVKKIAAVTTRKLGEREPTEHEPWDGTERRNENVTP